MGDHKPVIFSSLRVHPQLFTMFRACALANVVAAKHIDLDWSDCSSDASHGKITSLVTDPDPLQLGSTGHVTASGTLDKDLTDAEYNIVVKVLGVKVVDNTHSMCSDNSFDIKVAGVKVGHVDVTALDCPLAAGALRVDMDLSLTGVVPAGVGGATISLTAQDADAEELACMEMDAKIVKDAAVTDTCSLYEIGDGQCGQSDLDCAYVKYAKAAEKDLKDGTCVDQGYTHVTGTTTRTYPIIGDIVITMYDQEGLAVADTCSLTRSGTVSVASPTWT